MIAQAQPFHYRHTPQWHTPFLAMVPAIAKHAKIAFRERSPEEREELVQECVANCLAAYVRLVQLGKQDLAYPSVLARYAVAQIRDGRRIGSRMNVKDVSSLYCRQRKGVNMTHLHRYDKAEERWKEVVVEDKRSGPAEIAATRIDFTAWLRSLPQRNRQIAKELATGESTQVVAGRNRWSTPLGGGVGW